MKKTHDYIHHYRGYWSDGGKCHIRIYWEEEHAPVVICSELPDNGNTSVLAIVPGDRTVTARCDTCWRYGNPREFVEVRPGGRKNAYSGTCGACAEEEG